MKTHELKTWPEPFRGLFFIKKNFEIRKNDRDFNLGDLLYLREWDPVTKEYSDRYVIAEVTFIMHVGQEGHCTDGLEKGYCAMGIEILKTYP